MRSSAHPRTADVRVLAGARGHRKPQLNTECWSGYFAVLRVPEVSKARKRRVRLSSAPSASDAVRDRHDAWRNPADHIEVEMKA